MMIGRESSIRSYDHLGLPESHHQLSHHKNDPATIAKLVKIQTYHMELFAKFVAKLKATRDGDVTLLDRSLIVYGAGIADSNRHTHDKLPVLVVGKGNGSVKSGRHVDFGKDTPVTNLLLAVLDRVGVRRGSPRRQHRPTGYDGWWPRTNKSLAASVSRGSLPGRMSWFSGFPFPSSRS